MTTASDGRRHDRGTAERPPELLAPDLSHPPCVRSTTPTVSANPSLCDTHSLTDLASAQVGMFQVSSPSSGPLDTSGEEHRKCRAHRQPFLRLTHESVVRAKHLLRRFHPSIPYYSSHPQPVTVAHHEVLRICDNLSAATRSCLL